jgi:hypothetical protein
VKNKRKQVEFCTYFDQNYLDRGLVMIKSLHRFDPELVINVLCLDIPTFKCLSELNFHNVNLIDLKEIELNNPDLHTAKNTRSLIEYYFTLTPILIGYVNEKSFLSDKWIIYIDADIFFFDSVMRFHEEYYESEVVIIPHNFNHKIIKRFSKYGKYNVGYVGFYFKQNKTNICHSFWQESCLSWCFDKVEGERYADQGYLSRFNEFSSEVYVSDNLGANVAPWNCLDLSFDSANDGLYVNATKKLIFFHFHSLKKIKNYYFPAHYIYKTKLKNDISTLVYKPYIYELEEIGKYINDRYSFDFKSTLSRGNGFNKFVIQFRNKLFVTYLLLTKQYIKL